MIEALKTGGVVLLALIVSAGLWVFGLWIGLKFAEWDARKGGGRGK